MAVGRFFLFLREARKVEARRYGHLCDIQSISICRTERFTELRRKYLYDETGPVDLPKKPELPGQSAIDSGSPDAAGAILAMGRAMKGAG